MKEIKILISDEKYKEIMELVEFKNTRNKLYSVDKVVSIEDFARSALYESLSKFQNYHTLIELSGLNNPDKPFKFKNNFKQLIKERYPNISQVKISEMTGINRSNLNQILNNITQPRLDFFLRLWIILDFPPIEQCISRIDD